MDYIKLIKIIFGMLPSLVRTVEAFVSETGQGAEKKVLVKEILRGIVNGIMTLSTGGQADTWSKLEGLVDGAIDGIVSMFNVFGWFDKE